MASRSNKETGGIPSWLKAIVPGADSAEELKTKSPKAIKEQTGNKRKKK